MDHVRIPERGKTGLKEAGVEVRLVAGAGDDCAVLDLDLRERSLLFKTDAVVEGIHFAADAPPKNIGRKALGRCLSDIAAMAGTPTAALVTIALPRKCICGSMPTSLTACLKRQISPFSESTVKLMSG